MAPVQSASCPVATPPSTAWLYSTTSCLSFAGSKLTASKSTTPSAASSSCVTCPSFTSSRPPERAVCGRCCPICGWRAFADRRRSTRSHFRPDSPTSRPVTCRTRCTQATSATVAFFVCGPTTPGWCPSGPSREARTVCRWPCPESWSSAVLAPKNFDVTELMGVYYSASVCRPTVYNHGTLSSSARQTASPSVTAEGNNTSTTNNKSWRRRIRAMLYIIRPRRKPCKILVSFFWTRLFAQSSAKKEQHKNSNIHPSLHIHQTSCTTINK